MRITFTLVLLIAFNFVFAQKQYGIGKMQWYYKEFVPGVIQVDENGRQLPRPHDTTFMAILEVHTLVSPIWQKAWVNNKAYNVLTTKMPASYTVGTLYNTEKKVTLKAKTGNRLLQLNLEASGLNTQPPSSYKSKLRNNAILLQGVFKNKMVYVLVPAATRLMPDEHP